MNNDRKNRMTKKTGGPAFPTQGYDHGAAMTSNKPEVQRYDDMGCPEQICRVDTMPESDDGDYVLYEDYEALREECEKLRAESQRLIEVLSDYYSQNKCGCGHPACKRCLDDRFVEDALAAHRKGGEK